MIFGAQILQKMLLECVMNVNMLAVKVNDTRIFFPLKHTHLFVFHLYS